MKKILFITLLAFGMSAKAQITLEHTFDSASTNGGSGFVASQLVYVKLAVSGEKYLNINKTGKYISVYNLNHSLMKNISYASFPQACNGIATFLYFSENLFDNDNLMEFMYIWGDCPGTSHTRIYKEDGTCIFSADSMAPIVDINVQQLQYPIFNTSLGTKMILSQQYNGTAKLYSLTGTLTSGIDEANNNLIAMQTGKVSNAYPNPNNGSTKIDYILPDGFNEGEIVFYNLMGNEVKRFKVDRTFNTLLVSTKDIAAGTYYYQLQTSAGSSGGEKMVVIK
jgi:hypothetical protein